jgi:hypothetical protein
MIKLGCLIQKKPDNLLANGLMSVFIRLFFLFRLNTILLQEKRKLQAIYIYIYIYISDQIKIIIILYFGRNYLIMQQFRIDSSLSTAVRLGLKYPGFILILMFS